MARRKTTRFIRAKISDPWQVVSWEVAIGHVGAVELERAGPVPVDDLAAAEPAYGLDAGSDGAGRGEEGAALLVVLGAIVELDDLAEHVEARGVAQRLGAGARARAGAAVEEGRADGCVEVGGRPVEHVAEHVHLGQGDERPVLFGRDDVGRQEGHRGRRRLPNSAKNSPVLPGSA